MKVLFLFVICFVASTSVAVAQSDIKLKIGARLPRKYALASEEQIATHPSQFRPFIRKTIADVDYIIAFDDESRKIRFIQTTDKDFRTANGLRVGSQITVTREQLTIFPGWYIFAPATSDGWRLIVAADGESLDKLKDKETILVTIGGFVKGGN